MLRMPILTYHDVLPFNTKSRDVEPSLRPYVLPVKDFERQMEIILSEGYAAMPLNKLVNGGVSCNPYPDKMAVITFDDGLTSNYYIAYPILKKYGLTATFFVIASKVGENGMMTWEQLKEMAENNMTIGSHTLTHRYPSELSEKEIEHELMESKKVLEDKLGIKINLLSIPTGFHNKKMPDIAKRVGYAAVCSGVEGVGISGTAPYVLKSVCIRNGISDGEFVGILHHDRFVAMRRRLRQLMLKTAKKLLGLRRYNAVRASLLSKLS